MKDVLDQIRVLCLNKHWQAVATVSVRRAFKDMSKDRGIIYWCSSCRAESHSKAECTFCGKSVDREEDIPFRALHIDWPQASDGTIDFSSPVSILPVKWKDWVELPVRPFDKFVRTSKLSVRAPTVIIAEDYEKIPKKTPQYSNHEVAKRDEFIDQYTGLFCPKEDGNIDHVIARDLGGTTSWENCVWTSKKINQLKANLSPEEFQKRYGYSLIRKPVKPEPRIKIVNRYNIPEWNVFLKG